MSRSPSAYVRRFESALPADRLSSYEYIDQSDMGVVESMDLGRTEVARHVMRPRLP